MPELEAQRAEKDRVRAMCFPPGPDGCVPQLFCFAALSSVAHPVSFLQQLRRGSVSGVQFCSRAARREESEGRRGVLGGHTERWYHMLVRGNPLPPRGPGLPLLLVHSIRATTSSSRTPLLLMRCLRLDETSAAHILPQDLRGAPSAAVTRWVLHTARPRMVMASQQTERVGCTGRPAGESGTGEQGGAGAEGQDCGDCAAAGPCHGRPPGPLLPGLAALQDHTAVQQQVSFPTAPAPGPRLCSPALPAAPLPFPSDPFPPGLLHSIHFSFERLLYWQSPRSPYLRPCLPLLAQWSRLHHVSASGCTTCLAASPAAESGAPCARGRAVRITQGG